MEGKIWEPHQVKESFDRGSYAVVVGSAITRPQLIAKRFSEAIL
ncbi:MAG: N-acetylmannosamine-6-phosphate 2-epimerase, partial [Candidatus Sericytochromatia bacterium]